MAKIFIVDNAGARVASLDQSQARFTEATTRAFGQDIDLHAHTPQNQWVGIQSLVWTEVGEELVRAALYGASIDHAPGTFLDAFGSLLDIRRSPATHTRVVATLSGAEGVLVEAGSLARTSAGDQFKSLETASLTSTGVQVPFEAVNSGPVPCAAGELSHIVTVKSGWEFITNAADGTIGSNAESDAEYRNNLKAVTAHSSIGSVSALRSALVGAGALSTKILENTASTSTTVDGIVMPPHSIFVVASGGLYDDVVRATENHRGMGVATYAALIGNPVNIAEAVLISNGTIIFDGTSYTGINLSNKATINDIANTLNAINGLPNFETIGNSLMPFFSWRPGLTGFQSIESNISDAVPIRNELIPTEVQCVSGSTECQLTFDEDVRSVGGSISGATITYSTTDGTDASQSLGVFSREGRVYQCSFANALPASVVQDSIRLHFLATGGAPTSYNNVRITTDPIPVTYKIRDSSGLPQFPIGAVYAGPSSNGGITVSAAVDGTSIVRWEYRRSNNAGFLDSTWQSLSSSNSNLIEKNIPSTGVFRSQENFISVRAVNATGNSAPLTLTLKPTNVSAPALMGGIVDGSVIELEFDQELRPGLIAGAPATSPFTATVGGSSVSGFNIDRALMYGTKMYIEVPSVNSFAANAVVSLTYVPNAISNTRQKIQGVDNGLVSTAFTTGSGDVPALTNLTSATTPGRPTEVIAVRKASNNSVTLTWIGNDHVAGKAVDLYEYSLSTNNGATWGAWQPYDVPNSPPTPFSTSFTSGGSNRIRVRAQNANTRLVRELGLEGLALTGPVLRPVDLPLSITLNMAASSTLTGDAVENIRNLLVQRVASYDIGEEIWVKDLEAVVEAVDGARVNSISTTRKLEGIKFTGSFTPRTFQKWSLAANDIDITFRTT